MFDTTYREHHDGAKPTWGAKQGRLLKQLLKAHGAEEVQRRIGVLFDSPPSWLESRDFGTLVQHFDKLAAPTAPGRGPSGQDIPELWGAVADELERRGR